MRGVLSALAVAIAAAACTCSTPFHNQTYACQSTNDCANSFTCVRGICVSTGAVGGGAGGGGGFVDSGCMCLGCEVCAGGACAVLDAGSEPEGCGAYRCDGLNPDCPPSCTQASDCIAGADCVGGQCVGTLDGGAPCTKDGACLSGHCADTVCCDSACAGPCDLCNVPATLGACVPANAGAPGDPVCAPYFCPGDDAGCATSCHADNECAGAALCVNGVCQPLTNGSLCMADPQCESTHCVDGHCCASACDGSCDRCDDPLSLGNCVPFTGGSAGAPSCGPYVCDGTSPQCPAACLSGSECSASGFCDGGSCVTKRGNGEPCLDATECLSDHCVAGLCCGTGCGGGCFSCNQPGDAGNCLPIPPGKDPAAACAGAYACNGDGGCFTACATPASCESGALCFMGQCVTDLPNSAPCDAGTDCSSGLCEQGVCCGTVCGGCSACNTPGKLGTCVNAMAGTDPSAVCTGGLSCNGDGGCYGACSASAKCETGYACDGGACQKVQGSMCSAGSECASGFCTDGVCCNSTCTGVCKSCNRPGFVGLCGNTNAGLDPDQECAGGLACSGNGACNTSCNPSGGCETTYLCSGNTCVLKTPNGMGCTTSGACQSGFCRDSVCCATSCSVACQSCNVNGAAGMCTSYARGTDPDNECGLAITCGGDGGCLGRCSASSDCKVNFACSDAGTCLRKDGQLCGAGNACLSNLCVDGRCCNAACSGACDSCNLPSAPGVCTNQAVGVSGAPSCLPFVCNGGASCPTACTAGTDCVSGGACDGGRCLLPNGYGCALPSQCTSNRCVDFACCNSACNGACQSCSSGTCAPTPLGQDPANECGAYYCNGSTGCAGGCSSDGSCKPGNYCDGLGTCQPKQAAGANCGAAHECQSGSCADGVCCNSDCLGQCVTCIAVTRGVCSPATPGTDPDNECGLYLCTATGVCATSCVDGSVCKSGACDPTNVCTP